MRKWLYYNHFRMSVFFLKKVFECRRIDKLYCNSCHRFIRSRIIHQNKTIPNFEDSFEMFTKSLEFIT